MNAFDTARVGFKLIAVLVLFKAIEMLGWILNIPALEGLDGMPVNKVMVLGSYLVPFFMLLLLAAVLLLKTSALASMAVGRPAETEAPPESTLYPALLSAVGALLIGLSLVGLPEVLFNIAIMSGANFAPANLDAGRLDEGTRYWMYGVVLQFVAGVVLLVGSRRIAGLILKPLPEQVPES